MNAPSIAAALLTHPAAKQIRRSEHGRRQRTNAEATHLDLLSHLRIARRGAERFSPSRLETSAEVC